MVTLVRVEHDDLRLARLMQLYMHEWSALLPVPMGTDGIFVYEDAPAPADRDAHGAYVFLDDARVPLGFALLRRDADGCTHVEELFVLAGARKRGVGKRACALLFATRPGPWTLTVRPESPAALAFWRRVLPGAKERVELGDDGVARTRLSWIQAAPRA